LETADIAEWRRGWRIVLGAAVGLGTGIALYLTVASLFTTRVTAEFGWTRGDIGVAGAVAFLAGAVSLSVVGQILDRVGFRRVVLVCVPMLCVVYFGIAAVGGSYPLYLVLMVMGGVFGAGTGAIAYTRPVIAAFDRQRGLALGVSAAGVSLTAIVMPPLLTILIGMYGWRAGLYALVVVTLCIGLPIALWLIGRARETMGAEVRDALSDAPEKTPELLATADISLRDALRGKRFWVLALALVAVNIPGSGVVGQLAPMITDKGLSEAAAGLALSIYVVGLLIGRLVTGLALDRFPAANVAAFMTAVPAIGAALLLVPESSFLLAAIAVALIGLQQGSEVDLLAYFVSRGFGFKNYSSIFGAIATAGALSTATGLVLFGKVHEAMGNYDAALIIGAVAFLIGAMAFYSTRWLKPPQGNSGNMSMPVVSG
ncbi:MAG: MFS transporter, partial [Alphaproteobacteria bacterium]|nr:MFS transporter [Alphaproteobacteria bacterium]